LVLLGLKSYGNFLLPPHALGLAPSLPPTSKILVPPMIWIYWWTINGNSSSAVSMF